MPVPYLSFAFYSGPLGERDAYSEIPDWFNNQVELVTFETVTINFFFCIIFEIDLRSIMGRNRLGIIWEQGQQTIVLWNFSGQEIC